jgi:hypothetical protein
MKLDEEAHFSNTIVSSQPALQHVEGSQTTVEIASSSNNPFLSPPTQSDPRTATKWPSFSPSNESDADVSPEYAIGGATLTQWLPGQNTVAMQEASSQQPPYEPQGVTSLHHALDNYLLYSFSD